MGLTDYVAKQFARPHGALAPVMAALLNAVNKNVNRAALDAAEPIKGQTVVDVGFGGGVGLKMALERVGRDGRIVAVDPSEEMVARAKRRYKDAIAKERLIVAVGEAARLPIDDGAADAVYAVNTVYFWPQLDAGLREILRALTEPGRAVIAVQPSVIARHERFSGMSIPTPAEIEQTALSIGFRSTSVDHPSTDVVTVVLMT